eukprot:CAMPEP_0185041904 /NCGR_PEP_ID=MMETSP1103-20130426/41765_1 /TAXON_ID=36769 /ORGANISM="Paraphysomonas bandaiensis, Strain Caron Lab Isolate" /LENGTH=676 /DNA_ID=CAMNT_0027581837 /DNA_START=129 /DNA_END=2159 /DNA_ORIENTATION=+
MQLSAVGDTISQYEDKLQSISPDSVIERSKCASYIIKLKELHACASTLIEILSPLRIKAERFWFCGPVDHTTCLSVDKSEIHRWRVFRDVDISASLKLQIAEFKADCRSILNSYFADMLELFERERQFQDQELEKLENRPIRLHNKLPLSALDQISRTCNSFISTSMYPYTHIHIVDTAFAKRLGYSVSRLLAMPVITFVVNTRETETIINELVSGADNPTLAILFYRSITRKVVAVHWEISTMEIDDMVVGCGIDITQEIESTHLKQAIGVQKMLRQWLHSIRNASFEQQARVILDETAALESRIDNNSYADDFRAIYDSINLLIHTAKTSVGLIDQALDTTGLIQQMAVVDFVNNLTSFPHHFASSEGMGAVYCQCVFILNGKRVQSHEFGTLFVTGEVVNIQSALENIIANAVRTSDPISGIIIELEVQQMDNKLQFRVNVVDNASGGMPLEVFQYLERELGPSKCQDERKKGSETVNVSSPRHGGSQMGLWNLVELYHILTQAGGNDFDLRVTTQRTGSTVSMRFTMDLMAPVTIAKLPSSRSDHEHARKKLKGTLLVVDDSVIIRKIIGKYLLSLDCAYQICSDGSEALQWFSSNARECAGVITDLEMPKVGGDALIASIKEMCPTTPCVLVSGNDIGVDKLPLGTMRAIVKPITLPVVESIIIDFLSLQE